MFENRHFAAAYRHAGRPGALQSLKAVNGDFLNKPISNGDLASADEVCSSSFPLATGPQHDRGIESGARGKLLILVACFRGGAPV